jgi:hypothetical protein
VHESEAKQKQKLVDTWSSQTNMLLSVLIECKAVDTHQQKAFLLSSTVLMSSHFHGRKQISPLSEQIM